MQVRDRRMQKTRELLHRALNTLIREKPYDSISVTEILDRANVGRSTFYTHFHDKDELLVSGIHDLLHSVRSRKQPPPAKLSERMTSFSLPILEHIDQHRHAGGARMSSKGRALLHDRLRGVLAELIAEEIAKCVSGRKETAGQIPPGLLAEYISSTFVLVLNWWVDSKCPLPPTEANDLFRALALPTLAAFG